MKIINKVTWGQLETIGRHLPETAVCVAKSTCWWCFKEKVLYHHDSGALCDPTGSLLSTTNLGYLITAARINPERFGKHGIDAYMAAYDGNLLDDNGKPTSFKTWDEYNDLLDRQGVEDAPEDV